MRAGLVAAAQEDARIVAAALTGSVAVGREDEWSDIDLAFAVDPAADVDEVVADWTARMYRHGVVDHLDVWFGATLFRVFLLADSLQVDLAFWPAAEFGAVGPKFKVLFGDAPERAQTEPPQATQLIRMGWLYALHARSSIARGRVWQAEYMISALRDQVFALACLRRNLPAVEGRGMDDLPAEITRSLEQALVRSVEPPDLKKAFAAATDALLVQTILVDPRLAVRITRPLLLMTR